MSMPLFWLILALFFLIIELLTTTLVSVWFIPASLVTALVALVWDNIPAQIVIFLVLSVVSLVLFNKFYRGKLKKKSDSVNADQRLIGRSATAAEPISSEGGKVLVGDIYWRAVNKDDSVIESGAFVEIKSVNGTTLVVSKK